MKITSKTTTKQFNEFKASFIHWQNRFGLTDWRVVFEHAPIEDSYATLTTNVEGRIATAQFNSNVLDGFNPSPKDHGLHEAIHLLLARIAWLGKCRFLDDNELLEEEEALVRRLEKALGRETM